MASFHNLFRDVTDDVQYCYGLIQPCSLTVMAVSSLLLEGNVRMRVRMDVKTNTLLRSEVLG